jgi:sugar lactone lactonase YvrE
VFALPVQNPTSLLHDANGALYVAAGAPDSAILVYSPNANPGDPPMRKITAGLTNPSGICLDAQGNLYVADAGLTGLGVTDAPSQLLEFSPNADGNARPIATFQLPPDNTAVAYGVAVDGQGTVLVATGRPVNGSGAGLFVYAPGSNANPKQVLKGFGNPQQLAFDADGNLYETSTNPQPQVTVFSPPDYQQFPRGITSPVLQDPYGVAVDGQGQIYVADRGAQAVFVFDKAAGQGVQQVQPVQTLMVAPLVPYGLDWSPFP